MLTCSSGYSYLFIFVQIPSRPNRGIVYGGRGGSILLHSNALTESHVVIYDYSTGVYGSLPIEFHTLHLKRTASSWLTTPFRPTVSVLYGIDITLTRCARMAVVDFFF